MLRRLVRLACFVTVLVALKYGYDFGHQLSGPWLGVVLAINAAVFSGLVVGMLAERVTAPH